MAAGIGKCSWSRVGSGSRGVLCQGFWVLEFMCFLSEAGAEGASRAEGNTRLRFGNPFDIL